MRDYSGQVEKIRTVLEEADAVIIGAGAGMSASAGFSYSGERFQKYFYDYEQIKFCTNGETYEECNKKLVDFLKDKTNYDLTEEEIEKQDFQKYYGYFARKGFNSGKILDLLRKYMED